MRDAVLVVGGRPGHQQREVERRPADDGQQCGGDEQTLARVRPVLDGFARDVAVMGGPGAGMAAKIARNVIVYGCLRAGYEGAALARAAGVEVSRLARVVEDSADAVGGPMRSHRLPYRSSNTATVP